MILSFLFICFSILTAAICDEVSPPPGSVKLKSYFYAGNGCPSGGVGAGISPDQLALWHTFDFYGVTMGPNISIMESTRNCLISNQVAPPTGFSFAIASMKLDGYKDLEDGVVVRYNTSGQLNNGTRRVETIIGLEGPEKGPFSVTMDLNGDREWSPCGQDTRLSIIMRARITTTVKGAKGTTFGLFPIMNQTLGLKWKLCGDKN